MKKIPTLFRREFEQHKLKKIFPEVTEGLEEVLQKGIATVKWDGSCCAIISGKFYKRYDAKKGKPVPANAIKCQEAADAVTGHLPCWVPCDRESPADKWFWAAYDKSTFDKNVEYQTFEAIGKHFQGNPYEMEDDLLVPHGKNEVNVERNFEAIKAYLSENVTEGLVFWLDGEPKAKIKRSDFGFEWPVKEKDM